MIQNIWKKKLCSDCGETIGEALAAMLVVALGALMLAAMTSAATRIVTRSETAYIQYLDQRNAMESGKADIKKNYSGNDSSFTMSEENGKIKVTSSFDASTNVRLGAPIQQDVKYTVVRKEEKNILVTYHAADSAAGTSANP